MTVRKTEGAIPDVSAFNDLAESGVFGDPRDIVQVVKSGGDFVVSFKSKEAMLKVAGNYRKETPTGTFFVDAVERKRSYLKVYDLPYEVENNTVEAAFKDYGTVGSVTRDKFPGRAWYNGIRTVPIHLEDAAEIPDRMLIDGFEAKVLNTSVPHCMLCKKNGHSRRNCPEMSCHNCGEWGHFSNRCPEARCTRCHGLGHWARQCRHGLEDRSVAAEGGRKEKPRKERGPVRGGPSKQTYAEVAVASKEKAVEEGESGEDDAGKSTCAGAAAAGAVAPPPCPPRRQSFMPRIRRAWADICDEDEQGEAGGVFKRRSDQPLPTANRFGVLNDESNMDTNVDLDSQFELLREYEEQVVMQSDDRVVDTGGAAT